METSPKRRVTVARVRAAAEKVGKVREAADYGSLPGPVRKDLDRAYELLARSLPGVGKYVAEKVG